MHDRHLDMDTEQLMHGQILAELSKIRADLSIIKGRLASLELSTQPEQIKSPPIRISDLSQRSRAELERWNREQDEEIRKSIRPMTGRKLMSSLSGNSELNTDMWSKDSTGV